MRHLFLSALLGTLALLSFAGADDEKKPDPPTTGQKSADDKARQAELVK